MSGKYNKYAGNQTARDFFWFYFSSIFPMKVAGGRIHSSQGNLQPPLLYDSPVNFPLFCPWKHWASDRMWKTNMKILWQCQDIYYMQKIASHCKLICSQIDKTVSSTNISGMLFCCKKKVNQGWQNCCKKQQCILFWGLWLKACVTASWLCCDCS